MSHSGYFDVALSIPLLWGIYRGFCKGFIIELASLVSLAFGIYGAIKLSGYVSVLLREKFALNQSWLPILSFAAVFILIVVGVYLLAKLLETVVNVASLKPINKIAGALFGMIKMGIIAAFLLLLMIFLDQKINCLPQDIKSNSFFYQWIVFISSRFSIPFIEAPV